MTVSGAAVHICKASTWGVRDSSRTCNARPPLGTYGESVSKRTANQKDETEKMEAFQYSPKKPWIHISEVLHLVPFTSIEKVAERVTH